MKTKEDLKKFWIERGASGAQRERLAYCPETNLFRLKEKELQMYKIFIMPSNQNCCENHLRFAIIKE